MSIHALHDDHGRTVRYLRLSLTDRCNLRCLYCHSNARHQCIPHEKVLRYEEMIRLVQIVRGMGVGKVRLTGGEPFARKGCDDFLLRLRQRFDDLDIRITTNGTLLEEHIPLLQRIRIRINISQRKVQHTALTYTKQIARTAQLHIPIGNFESIVRFAQDIETLADLFSIKLMQKNTVRLRSSAANAAAQLMQLCQPESL